MYLRRLKIVVLATAMGVCSQALGAGASLSGFTISYAPYNYAKDNAVRAAFKEVARAQTQVDLATDAKRRIFESTDDWQQAVHEALQARAEYDRIRSMQLSVLHNTPQYIAAQIEIYKLQESLEAMRAEPLPKTQKIHELANQLLNKRAALSNADSRELAANEVLTKTRYAMIDAEAKLNALRKEFVQSIRLDPKWREARTRLDSARASLKAIR
ncbi:MAG TPA: hypothetical protein VHD56_06520 [Tepidisphaeraceae bacterium]|nr:hypothetical protein [Tepidisphaeraceae bacterium]